MSLVFSDSLSCQGAISQSVQEWSKGWTAACNRFQDVGFLLLFLPVWWELGVLDHHMSYNCGLGLTRLASL